MGNGRTGCVTTGSHGGRDDEKPPDEIKRGTSFSAKLGLGALLFCVLTLSTYYYQFSSIREGEAAFSWHRLDFRYLWLLILCLPFDTFASALRIWLVCRVLERGAGLWTCLKAEWQTWVWPC
jgi:hypothetical protein